MSSTTPPGWSVPRARAIRPRRILCARWWTGEPDPEAILELCGRLGRRVHGHQFERDHLGWHTARILLDDCSVPLDRYLIQEEGLRGELNTWAAWVEAAGDSPAHLSLMQQLI